MYSHYLVIALWFIPLLALPSSAGGWPPKGNAAYQMALFACIAASQTDDEEEIARKISEGYQRALRRGILKADLDWSLGPQGQKLVDALLRNLISNPCQGNDQILNILEDKDYYPSINPAISAGPFKKNPDAFRVWLNTKTTWPGYRKVVFGDLSKCRQAGSETNGPNMYSCDSAYATFTSPLGSEVCSLYDLVWSGSYLDINHETGQRTKAVQGEGASFKRLTCRWLYDSRFKR